MLGKKKTIKDFDDDDDFLINISDQTFHSGIASVKLALSYFVSRGLENME